MRAVLIGAGSLPARRLARDLIEEPEVTSVVVVDRDPSLAETAAGETGKSLPVAVAISTNTIAELAEGNDVVLSCLTNHEEEVAAATGAIQAGVPYASASPDAATFETLSSLGENLNVVSPVLLGCGWTPGLTGLMARLGSAELTAVSDVQIFWVMSGADKDAVGWIELVASALTETAPVFQKHAWRRELAGSLEQEVYFPEPVGWRTVRLASAIEPLSLPEVIPGAESVTVKAGFTERFADRATRAARRLHTSLGLGARLSSSIGKVVGASSGTGGPARSWSAARVDVVGQSGDAVSYGVVDQLPNLISAPLLATAFMIYRGELKEPRVQSASNVIDPRPFFSAVAERGVRIAKLERGGHVDRF